MRVVYKHHLEISGFIQEIPASKDARILCVQMQNAGHPESPNFKPTVWIELDPERIDTNIKVRIVTTGQNFNFKGNCIGTFQDGWFVGHVYQIL